MVFKKTLESPLDGKEVQQVHSKGDQSWEFIGRNDVIQLYIYLYLFFFRFFSHLDYLASQGPKAYSSNFQSQYPPPLLPPAQESGSQGEVSGDR